MLPGKFPRSLAIQATKSGRRVEMEKCSSNRQRTSTFSLNLTQPGDKVGITTENERKPHHTNYAYNLPKSKLARTQQPQSLGDHPQQSTQMYDEGALTYWCLGRIISLMCHLYVLDAMYITLASDGIQQQVVLNHFI